MKCPIDGTSLVISERSGVEIDFCPQCRGVWLDRGELDKILDRAAAVAPQPARGYDDRAAAQPLDQDGYRKKKRGGFLDDIFDF